MRKIEGNDFPIKLLFALYNFKEFDRCPYRYGHAIGILLVSNNKCCGTVLYFACYKHEIHLLRVPIIGGRSIHNLASKSKKFFKLIAHKC